MLHAFARRFLLAAAVASLVACGGSDDPPAGATPEADVKPTLTDIQAKVLTPTCATSSCHDGNATDNKLNLTAGKTFSQTVGKGAEKVNNGNLVKPGDPGNSLMYTLLSGPKDRANQMPKGRGTLGPKATEAIRQWIADGALDN